MGDAVGRAARRPGAAGRVPRSGAALAAARNRRADDVARARLRRRTPGGGSSISRSATTRAPRFESLLREGLAQAGTPSQKAVVVRHAAQRRAHAGHGRLAAAGVGEEGNGERACRSPKPTTPRWRSSSRCAQVDGWSDILKTQLARIENPDRKRPLPVRDAGALGRSGRAREVVPVARGRRQPPPRAVGARRPRATCITRCAPTRRRNTCSRASRCCGRSRRPAISSSRSAGSTRRSAATRRRTWRIRCAAFLKNLPANYPERLRNITLQSADELYRAAEIVKK